MKKNNQTLYEALEELQDAWNELKETILDNFIALFKKSKK